MYATFLASYKWSVIAWLFVNINSFSVDEAVKILEHWNTGYSGIFKSAAELLAFALFIGSLIGMATDLSWKTSLRAQATNLHSLHCICFHVTGLSLATKANNYIKIP